MSDDDRARTVIEKKHVRFTDDTKREMAKIQSAKWTIHCGGFRNATKWLLTRITLTTVNARRSHTRRHGHERARKQK